MDQASVEDEADLQKVESGDGEEEGYVKVVVLLFFHADDRVPFDLNFLRMIFYVTIFLFTVYIMTSSNLNLHDSKQSCSEWSSNQDE